MQRQFCGKTKISLLRFPHRSRFDIFAASANSDRLLELFSQSTSPTESLPGNGEDRHTAIAQPKSKQRSKQIQSSRVSKSATRSHLILAILGLDVMRSVTTIYNGARLQEGIVLNINKLTACLWQYHTEKSCIGWPCTSWNASK